MKSQAEMAIVELLLKVLQNNDWIITGRKVEVPKVKYHQNKYITPEIKKSA
jgi:hypothetical protein